MLSYYLCAIVTLISATVSLGFSIDAVRKSRNDGAMINARYAFSRSLSLFVVALGLLFIHSNPYLITITLIMIGVQFIDGIVGIKVSRFKTWGPLLTAIGNAIFLGLFLFI